MDEWFDSSGLTLYYTPKLRTYNAGLMNLGQTYLSIPPGQTSWVHQGTCTGDCTRRYMTGDIQVFAAQSHMHYLGQTCSVAVDDVVRVRGCGGRGSGGSGEGVSVAMKVLVLW